MIFMNGQPPIPTLTDLAPALAIMAMITDAEATKARLDQLAAASAEARSAIEQATQGQKDLTAARAAHDETVAQERAAHDAALAKERSDFLSECGARERALDECTAKIGRTRGAGHGGCRGGREVAQGPRAAAAANGRACGVSGRTQ